MKTMLLAAAAALTLGSATAFAAPANTNDRAANTAQQSQQMYQQYSQPAASGYGYGYADQYGVNEFSHQHYTGAIGAGGNG